MEGEMSKYQGLSLPLNLINEIKKHIKKRKEYKGVTEFVRQAIRDKISSDERDRLIKEGKIYDLAKIMSEKNVLQQASKNSQQNRTSQLEKKIDDILALLKSKN